MGARVGAAGLGAAALLASLACARPPAAATLRIGHESDVISLDPHAHREAATHSILSNVCEALVAFDRDMRLVPALAATWSTPDEHTWLVQLQRNVRFHDGRPLTAAEVKQSLDRARTEPTSIVKSHLAGLTEVEAVDAHTLRLVTREPEPLLMNRLTYVLISAGPPSETRLVGTGPYRLVRWTKGQALEVEAFDGYWSRRPAVGRVEFVPVEEGPASVAALREGKVDVLRWVPEPMAAAVQAVPRVRVAARSGLATYYLWFNTTPTPRGAPANPFADRRVRQAVSAALDRDAIVAALGGHGVPAHQLVQQGVFGFIGDMPTLPPDPARARRLLEEAGYGKGFTARLVHRQQASLAVVANVVRQALAPLGVDLQPETPPWPEVVEGWNQARLPLFLAGWRFEDGDAGGFLRDCLYTRDAAGRFGGNNPGYTNPTLDRLIDENGRIFVEGKRLQHYEKIMRLAMEEMPLVPLYHKLNLYGVAERVRWQPRLDGKLLAAEMAVE